MRWPTGLVFSAPILLGVAWYAWSTFADLDRYRRALGAERKVLDLELYQVALHDALTRDLVRLTQPERPSKGRLPTLSLSLTRGALDQLRAGATSTASEDRYVKGWLEKEGRVHDVEVRYRGGQPWHHIGAQRSIKVHVDKGDLLDGVRVFNLINDPTPFGLEDQLILGYAREAGLLAPDYEPVWVRLNNHDLGIFRFESQPDESLIRRGRRVPGNMYSGDSEQVDPERGVGALFFGPGGWQKIASRSEEREAERPELLRFLAALNGARHREFAAYAAAELDLARFAAFDALDVLFGGSEHDYFSNHKLYADPYRGTLEPVAWSFRGFQQEASFNLVDHPLLLRLKLTPGFLALRDRTLYRLLTGPASVPGVRARAEAAMRALMDELAADPYWDAYKLLPRASRLHRFLTRPMTLSKWTLNAEAELAGFAARSRYLLDELERPGLSLRLGPWRPAGTGQEARLDLDVAGHAAYRLLELSTRAECAGRLEVWADVDRDGALDPARDEALIAAALGETGAFTRRHRVAAGVVLVPHPDPAPKRGKVRAAEQARRYSYFLRAEGCRPQGASLLLQSEVTLAQSRLELVSGAAVGEAVPAGGEVEAVPRFALGEQSPHPWAFPGDPTPRTLTIGPGTVSFPESQSFGPEVKVEIRPGTTLSIGPGASLVFHGLVQALGTHAAPIRVQRLEPTLPFGGLALQGPGTAGSLLRHLEVRGGSRAFGGAVDYTGVLNLHDSREITLESILVEDVQSTEDVLHAYAVEGLRLSELSVRAAPVDAVDLEFVQGELRGLWLVGAGDDAIDLMGSTLRIQDSFIHGAKNNGISVGEESQVSLHGVLVARAKTGILVKNASEARVLRSLIFGTEQAMRARGDRKRYGGQSRIGVSESYVLASEVAYDADKKSHIESAEIRTELPEEPELAHLRAQLLDGAPWSSLEESIRRQAERRGP